jgi:hypothetical protein
MTGLSTLCLILVKERGKKAQQLRTNWEAGFASDCIERGTNLS